MIRAEYLRELACSIDPVAFSQSLGINPDQWQKDLLLSTEKNIILNCSRQSGKSEIVAILGLHHALNNPKALVLVLSPSLRQSSELFKKVIAHYHTLGRPITSTVESALTLQLSNGSRIVSLPGTEKTIRGYSGVSLLLVDEAARVDEDLYIAVRPMLAVSGGRLILLSTPASMRGFFHREWTEGVGWKKVMLTAEQCPRISAEFLEEEKRSLGERHFRAEYMCSFEENDAALFSHDLIFASLKSDLKEWDLGLEDLDDATEDLEDVEIIEAHEAKADNVDKERAEAGKENARLKNILAWDLGAF
jgi:hypothetical protein